VQNRIHFAHFELDRRAGELRKKGVKVRLQEQPFRVLALLLEKPGEVVTREELRSRLWPADTFVDFDHRLAAAVSKLRDSLGDAADRPTFVETVGRRGYRFLHPLQENAPPAPTPEGSPDRTLLEGPSLSTEPRPPKWRPALRRGAEALLLVLAVLLLGRGRPPEAALPHISSIAVLPLENLSDDPEQEYFVDGMTDEIITDLAKLPGIRVISRTSAVHYKGTRKTMPEIARELNVDAVLEGTVLRVGDRVRIRTQLVYAPADRHIWAQAYERDLKDVLTLQATLAEDIASQIRLTLTSAQLARLAPAHSVDPEVHELYLRGRHFASKRDRDGLARAIDLFGKAVVRDPTYAAAYAGLADSYALSAGLNLTSVDEVVQKARAAAEKALEIDGNLAEAHTSLGLIALFSNWDWANAERHYKRALELDPNYATAHHWYAEGYLMPVGRAAEAIAEIRKARELDPLSPVVATDLGKELYFVHRYDEALAELHRALELDPSFVAAHNWISDTLLEKGMYREAAAELEKTKPFKEERVYVRQTAYLYARAGKRPEARAAVARSLELSHGKPVSSGAVALAYAAIGDRDATFAWLERAFAERSSFMTSLKYWSVFDPLRGDPRFGDLIRRVGLPN